MWAVTSAFESLRKFDPKTRLIDMRPADLDKGMELDGVRGEITELQQQLSALTAAPPPDSEIKEVVERATSSAARRWASI
jgi:hypothetical protein